MRHLYDEFDEIDFSDNDMVARIMREQDREELRLASRRGRRSAAKRRHEMFEPVEEFSDVESFDEFDDYDDDEFDSYSDMELDR